ncbi:MAG: hypothetical protein JWN46_3788 [Acidimicrobiales bacterium]|nr:hypothetical protein [Acidimicrobiales bacterium]
MSWRTALALLVLVPAAGLGLAGCGTDAPTAAVTRAGGRVVVRYKPCHAGPRLDRLDLYGSDDPATPVWSARRRPGTAGTLELAVAPVVPGYQIVDRLGAAGPRAGVRYSFDAHSTDGTAWGGPDVRPERLAEGQVTVAGQHLAYRDWAARPATCPHVNLATAALAGLAVAGAAGLLMVVVRRPLRALAGRGRS